MKFCKLCRKEHPQDPCKRHATPGRRCLPTETTNADGEKQVTWGWYDCECVKVKGLFDKETTK